jgi:hypothetical protein
MVRQLFLVWCLVLLSAAWAQLLAPGMGVRASFFATPDLSGAAVVRYTPTLDLAWAADAAPIPDLKPGAFSVLYEGYYRPEQTGTYTFTVATTGGVRLLVKDKWVVDDWTPKGARTLTGTVALTAGTLTLFRLRFTHPAGAGSLKLIAAPGKALGAKLTSSQLYPPLFAPSWLVYADTLDLRTSALYLTPLDGTPREVAVKGSNQPCLSPDGRRLLFSTTANLAYPAAGIYKVMISGEGRAPLTRAGGVKCDPAFSGSGQLVAYTMISPGTWELWTMRADGSNRALVLKSTDETRHPGISRDGEFLVYQGTRNGQTNVYRVQADGSEEKPLSNDGGREPAVSPRGDKVAYVAQRGGRWGLYTVDPDGKNETQVLASLGVLSQPFFVTNSRQLAYLERDPKGNSDLFLLDLNDRVPCRVTATGKVFAATLAPQLMLPAGDSLAVWFNALRADTLDLDPDGRVNGWTDCARALVAAPVDPGTRPFFHKDGLNGNASVGFDGTALLRTPDISAGWVAQEGTMVALFMPRADAFTVAHQENSGGEWWRYNGNGDAYIGIFTGGRHENYPAQMPTTGTVLLTIISGGQYTAWINGTVQPPRGPAFRTPNTLLIGGGGDAPRFNGELAQLAIFNRALNEDERLAVEAYFRSLYGL